MGLKEQVLKDLQENFYKDFDNNLEEFDKVNPFMVFRLIELFSQSAYDFFKEDDKTIMQYVFKEDKEFPDEYTKEELLDRNHHLTVGDLKEFIQEHNIPDHAPVLYQRITDFYFKKGNWKVYLKQGYMVHQMLKHNIDIKGKFLNKEEYPDLPEQFFTEYTEQEIKEVNEQYIPAFSPVFYNEDKEILFIDAHY